jgi:hypothetical protein
MATRFIKPKIDKYIQLYSQYAANERGIYGSISAVMDSTIPTQASYSSVPILTITDAPSGGINATAICTLGGNGFINNIIITNPGAGYITVPTITAPAGNVTTGQVQTFTVTINLDRQRIFTWDLKTSIDLNENGLIQIVDRVFMNTSGLSLTQIFTFRILEISTLSVINSHDKSGLSNQSDIPGHILDIGIVNKLIRNDVKLEIQPQIINRITMSVDETITQQQGISGDVEFYISLKITEKEPSIIEYGSLNNININQ